MDGAFGESPLAQVKEFGRPGFRRGLGNLSRQGIGAPPIGVNFDRISG